MVAILPWIVVSATPGVVMTAFVRLSHSFVCVPSSVSISPIDTYATARRAVIDVGVSARHGEAGSGVLVRPYQPWGNPWFGHSLDSGSAMLSRDRISASTPNLSSASAATSIRMAPNT